MTDQEQFRDCVKDALTHLHDLAHLESHPLTRQLPANVGPSSVSRGQRLRNLLKQAIESLRPPEDIPAHLPEWRSYRVLYYRYIKGLGFPDMEYELGLSRRQLQREERKGVDGLSAMLWSRRIIEDAVEDRRRADGDEMQTMLSLLQTWQVERRACSVRSLLDDVRSVLGPLLAEFGVAIQGTIDHDLPPVLVDPVLTRQAMLKVLRLVAESLGSGPITLEAKAGDRMATIVVGIPKGELDPNAEDWQLASLLVGRQGGELGLESEPRGGQRVLVQLPQLTRARVLVVDDVRAAHRLLERYLAPHNYEIIGTSDPSAAVRLAQEIEPDGIILDVMMPSTDGWQVLRDLQRHPATAAIPVVVCSVLDEPQLAISLGARAFLKKPVQQLDLLATLDSLFNRASPC